MYFLSIYPLLENFPDMKILSLILAENPLFFPDFPDWKKFSKFSLFSLISLIGGNPDRSNTKMHAVAIRMGHPGDSSCHSFTPRVAIVITSVVPDHVQH